MGAGLLPRGKETIVSISLFPFAIETWPRRLPGPGWMMVAGAGFVMIHSSSEGIEMVARRSSGAPEMRVAAKTKKCATLTRDFIITNADEILVEKELLLKPVLALALYARPARSGDAERCEELSVQVMPSAEMRVAVSC